MGLHRQLTFWNGKFIQGQTDREEKERPISEFGKGKKSERERKMKGREGKAAGKQAGMAASRIHPPQLFRPFIFAHFLFAEANERSKGWLIQHEASVNSWGRLDNTCRYCSKGRSFSDVCTISCSSGSYVNNIAVRVNKRPGSRNFISTF